jgi:hypothetical protein
VTHRRAKRSVPKVVRGSLALLLVLVSGCAGGQSPDGRVAVPDLGGAKLRHAQCQLQRLGLRWRFRGDRHVYSGDRECTDEATGSSLDDIPVTGQTPRPGARVRRGAVIVVDDVCTDLARRGPGAGACA